MTPRLSPDDNMELLLKRCLLPRTRAWRRATARRLWDAYLAGIQLPAPECQRIELGRLHVARWAGHELGILEMDAASLLERHAMGDHGEGTSEEDALVNDFAKVHGGWVLSSYLMRHDAWMYVVSRPSRRTFVLSILDI